MDKVKKMPGPCCICGSTNYALSMGGPTICPKCDCGHFDAVTVFKQAEIIKQLRAALTEIREIYKNAPGMAAPFGDPEGLAWKMQDVARASLLTD